MTQARRRKQLDLLPKRNAAFIEPMECLAVSRLPAGAQWVWEIKLDGYRAIAVRSGGAVDLFSRREKSLSKKFPYIVEALAGLPEGTVVDGELVALDDRGRPEFNLLQNFRGAAARIHYYIFDLLCYEGRDLTRLPLVERRAFRSCSLLPWSCAAIVPLPLVKKIIAAQAVTNPPIFVFFLRAATLSSNWRPRCCITPRCSIRQTR
jgi:ATP dependent DNA ligase domain